MSENNLREISAGSFLINGAYGNAKKYLVKHVMISWTIFQLEQTTVVESSFQIEQQLIINPFKF